MIKSNRYLVTVNGSVAEGIETLSRKRGVSVSALIREFVELGLDLAEDFYWSGVADKAIEDVARGKSKLIPWESFKKSVRNKH